MDAPQSPAGSYPPATAAPKKSFAAKITGAVARHAQLSFAIIVVLLILVIGLYVNYHGFFIFGPYAAAAKSGTRSKRSKSGSDADSDSDGERSDPETERLIDIINHQ